MAKKVESKVVTVNYGLFDHPNKRGIEKAINKWGEKGYRLVSRSEEKPGCFTRWFTFFLARGRTELTFIKEE